MTSRGSGGLILLSATMSIVWAAHVLTATQPAAGGAAAFAAQVGTGTAEPTRTLRFTPRPKPPTRTATATRRRPASPGPSTTPTDAPTVAQVQPTVSGLPPGPQTTQPPSEETLVPAPTDTSSLETPPRPSPPAPLPEGEGSQPESGPPHPGVGSQGSGAGGAQAGSWIERITRGKPGLAGNPLTYTLLGLALLVLFGLAMQVALNIARR
jgi:hypothetical protein